MAITRSHSGLDVFLEAARTYIHQKYEQFQKARVRRKVFNTTYHELSHLSDRELGDLGIPRCNIARLALEAANDC